VDVVYIGEKRNRELDILVVEVKSGRVLIDNTDAYYGVCHLWNTRLGTVEYLQIQRERT
jgi:hypothetical protein